jgi:hypothetical protein
LRFTVHDAAAHASSGHALHDAISEGDTVPTAH